MLLRKTRLFKRKVRLLKKHGFKNFIETLIPDQFLILFTACQLNKEDFSCLDENQK